MTFAKLKTADQSPTTVQEFRAWLLDKMKKAKFERDHPCRDEQTFEECGRIVAECGDVAADVGFPDLYDESFNVASWGGDSGPTCTPEVAISYVSNCIGRCQTALSNPDTAIIGAQASRPGRSARRADNLPAPSSPSEKAYSWYKAAESNLGSKITDQEAYDWAVPHALDEGVRLPKFLTWTRYLRTARKARGDQKHWHREVPQNN